MVLFIEFVSEVQDWIVDKVDDCVFDSFVFDEILARLAKGDQSAEFVAHANEESLLDCADAHCFDTIEIGENSFLPAVVVILPAHDVVRFVTAAFLQIQKLLSVH